MMMWLSLVLSVWLEAGPYDPTAVPQPEGVVRMLSCGTSSAVLFGLDWYAEGDRLEGTPWTVASIDCARGVVRVVNGTIEQEWTVW